MQILDLKTACNHLGTFASDDEPRVRQSGQTSTIAGSATSQAGRKGGLAIVAVGNPLIEEDSVAIALIHLLNDRDICLFSFDCGFGWMKEVLKSHESVIILDSVIDTVNAQDGFVSIPLTCEVLKNSGFAIRATHGLSWLDEIKLHALEAVLPDPLLFFGIDGFIFKSGDANERSEYLKHALVELREVIEKCRTVVESETPVCGGSSHA